MKTTICGHGDPSSKAGCKHTISWDSFPGDWHQAYRCLDCDLVLCRQCMREHFGDHELRRDLDEALASAEARKAQVLACRSAYLEWYEGRLSDNEALGRIHAAVIAPINANIKYAAERPDDEKKEGGP